MTCAWTFHVRRYRFASPAEARERAKATLLDPSNPKEHVRLTYMMECICVLRMCRQVCLTVSHCVFGCVCGVGPVVPRARVCIGCVVCSTFAARPLPWSHFVLCASGAGRAKGNAEDECVRGVGIC